MLLLRVVSVFEGILTIMSFFSWLIFSLVESQVNTG